jgi:hypothetical protein
MPPRASNKKTFMELVLKWLESKPDRQIDPVWEDGLFGNSKVLNFPETKIPKEDLEALYLQAYGKPATRGFNGQGDIESCLAGVHRGSLKKKDNSTEGGRYLFVIEEGIRFYLTTGRNPAMHWSSVLDRDGNHIWEPANGWQGIGPHTWSKRYPKGWQP